MLYLISQISIVVYLISFVILFIGYWTYADYYTKIKSNILCAYWGTSAGIVVAATYMFFLAWGIKDIQSAMNVAMIISGIGSATALVIFGVILLNTQFQRSREYFRKKRNKVC